MREDKELIDRLSPLRAALYYAYLLALVALVNGCGV